MRTTALAPLSSACLMVGSAATILHHDVTAISSYDSYTKVHLTMNARLFSGTIRLPNRKIVWDSVRKITCDVPRKELSTL